MTNDHIRYLTKQVDAILNREYNHKTRTCACGCGKTFKRSNASHFFYSRSCYSRYHRIPGLFRKRMKEMVD